MNEVSKERVNEMNRFVYPIKKGIERGNYERGLIKRKKERKKKRKKERKKPKKYRSCKLQKRQK